MTFADQPAGTRRRRRLHSDEFKANAVAACMRPGMSMAAVAMAHGVNANLLRRWVREAEMKTQSVQTGKIVRAVEASPLPCAFVPVPLPASAAPALTADIRIELQRGATAVTVTWPSSAASECAAWMRELLR
ncbi:IS66-like element accessory protein TnpA [Burkholderia seminalis]|uniref:IS66-like element accessory protein TnpA n=1 Tax=Burkholderia seminalis TaxID=488731 RepID=UPI0019060EB1|nr:transposase [Burkholderia seminalis]MBJ9965624.1 transposase [Burkholderia seminalis]MDN7592170.1 transposase [Burkholderia seminalis]